MLNGMPVAVQYAIAFIIFCIALAIVAGIFRAVRGGGGISNSDRRSIPKTSLSSSYTMRRAVIAVAGIIAALQVILMTMGGGLLGILGATFIKKKPQLQSWGKERPSTLRVIRLRSAFVNPVAER